MQEIVRSSLPGAEVFVRSIRGEDGENGLQPDGHFKGP